MKLMVGSMLAVFLVLVGINGVHASEALETDATVGWIRFAEIFSGLRVPQRWAARSTETQQIAQGIAASAATLNNKWIEDANKQTPVPIVYFESLKADVDALRRLDTIAQYTARDDAIVRDVARDLELKVIHCHNSPTGWADTVKTKVSTTKNKQPVQSLEVWYSPRGWANEPNHWMRFPKLSTPTETALAPGIYMVRVKGGADNPMLVGDGGKKTTEFELIVD
jgi:hypothetical protein